MIDCGRDNHRKQDTARIDVYSQKESERNVVVMKKRLRLSRRKITGRKAGKRLDGQNVEGMVRIADDHLTDLAERSLAGIYLIQDEVFKYVNPKLADIFGYSIDELLAVRGPKEVVLPEDWPIVIGNIYKRLSGEAESLHYEFRGVTKGGTIINIEAYGLHTTYGGRPAVIGTLLDITRRKQGEELLRKAEEQYRGIFENAIEGIFQTTPDGRFIVVNPALSRMLGYDSPDDLVLSRTDIQDQLYVQPEMRTAFMHSLELNDVVRGFECELYKKDGSRILVSFNARAVKNADGATGYYEGTLEDITEKKKVENEFRLLSEFNEAIIDNAPVAIFTLDKKGTFTSINPSLASLSGLGSIAEKKLIGFNWVTNPYTIQCGLAGHIERGLRGEPFQLWDYPFMTYMGDRNIYMDFKGVPLKGKDGAIAGLLCIIEETTDRVRSRAKLMQETKLSVIGRLAAGIAHELNNPLGTLVAYSERATRYLSSFRDRSVGESELAKLKGYLQIIEEEAFRCKHVTADILSLSQKDGLEITVIDLNRLMEAIFEFMNINKSIRVVRETDDSCPFILGDINALRQVFVNLITNAVDAVEERMEATIWIRVKPVNGGDSSFVCVEIEDNGIGIPDAIVDKIFEPFYTTKESKKGIGLGLSLCYYFVTNMGGTLGVESKPGSGTTFSILLPAKKKLEGGSDDDPHSYRR